MQSSVPELAVSTVAKAQVRHMLAKPNDLFLGNK